MCCFPVWESVVVYICICDSVYFKYYHQGATTGICQFLHIVLLQRNLTPAKNLFPLTSSGLTSYFAAVIYNLTPGHSDITVGCGSRFNKTYF